MKNNNNKNNAVVSESPRQFNDVSGKLLCGKELIFHH